MNRILLSVAVLTGGLLTAGCITKPETPAEKAPVGPVAPTPGKIRPMLRGDSIPDVTLATPSGRAFHLAAEVARRPTVIVFYRGGWCPYCNKHLEELASIEHDLLMMGYQILAISPDRPEELRKTILTKKLTYQLLSDSDAEAARAFGLAFRVDDGTVTRYRTEYDIDLEAASGRDHHILPVPAVYVVDRSGVIRFQHVDPDYRRRLSGDLILAAARLARQGG